MLLLSLLFKRWLPLEPDWTGSSSPRASSVLMIAFSFSESKSISRVVGVVAGRSLLGEPGSPQEEVKMEGPKAADMDADGSVRDPDRWRFDSCGGTSRLGVRRRGLWVPGGFLPPSEKAAVGVDREEDEVE